MRVMNRACWHAVLHGIRPAAGDSIAKVGHQTVMIEYFNSNGDKPMGCIKLGAFTMPA